MQYPITLNFKILAIAPQIFVRDANGTELMYVKQKLFKFKEAINIFSDQSQSNRLYQINADRVIDFSARYNFSNYQDIGLGSIKRQGMRSLWKATYDIYQGDNVVFQIKEENALIKFMDAAFGEIPIIGMFSGYIFNPVYLVTHPGQDDAVVMRIVKKPALLESNFIIEQVDSSLSDQEEELILLGILMMVLLERSRG